jgi:hypothetical protein
MAFRAQRFQSDAVQSTRRAAVPRRVSNSFEGVIALLLGEATPDEIGGVASTSAA